MTHADSGPKRRSPERMRCLNCSEEISLHASLTEQFPEWSALTTGQGKPAKKTSVALSASTLSSASSAEVMPVPSAGGDDGTLSETVTRSANLFDLIADAQTPLEQPLCAECADGLLDELDGQLRSLEEEAAEFRSLRDRLARDAHSGPDLGSLKIELSRLQSEEAVVTAELRRLEAEEADVEQQLNEEKAAISEVRLSEERLYAEWRDGERKARELDAETASLANQLRYTEAQLDKLAKTNVFNLTFHIWHQGHFGTINGLRLGRLPDAQVEWTEINAAWGQTVLLLDCLCRKVGLRLERYELVPYGNASFIRHLPDPAQPTNGGKGRELPLYYAGGHKFMGNNKLDAGMLGFLDCLGQLKRELERAAGFSLPYGMAKDKLVDKGSEFSVKIQFNSEERWTKAMKLMLMNLKWALAWIASIHAPAS